MKHEPHRPPQGEEGNHGYSSELTNISRALSRSRDSIDETYALFQHKAVKELKAWTAQKNPIKTATNYN